MSVTRKEIIRMFASTSIQTEQVDSKQLFKVFIQKYKAWCYVSYKTVIAVKYNGQYLITDKSYSSTTTRHKNEIKKRELAIIVDSNYFNEIVEALRFRSSL